MLQLHSSPVDIVVLGDGSLLDDGLVSLLSRTAQFHVSRILFTDDSALFDLIAGEQPQVIFVPEFLEHNTVRIIGLIFSNPSIFVKCVVAVRLESNIVNIYDRVSTPLAGDIYKTRSVTVESKTEFINLACNVSG